MRVLGTLTLMLCLPLTTVAQYANDWLLTGRQYLKISVAEDAIYKLTYDDLVAAGLQVSAIDPRLIQVFHRGKEQAILFHHGQTPANAQFESNEYLEFYGRRNDGTLDSKLYQPASAQPHPYYNLFSDSAAYFLTWNTMAVQGKRMEEFDQVNSTGIPKETAMVVDELKLYAENYCEGPGSTTSVAQSFFDQGEGWTGLIICSGQGCVPESRDFTFANISQTVAGFLPRVEVFVAGRDEVQHQVELLAGPNTGALRLIATRSFSNFETSIISENLALSDIGDDGKIIFRVRALPPVGVRDRVSVSYIKFTYPQSFDFDGVQTKTFALRPNANGKSYVEILNSVPGTRIFDISDPSAVVLIGTHNSGPALTAVIPNTTSSRTMLTTAVTKNLSPSQLDKVSFRPLNYQARFVIVGHRSLTEPGGGYTDPVEAYAAYRASIEGGGYDTLTVMIDELYDQFNYGEKSPLAIREFMRRMIDQGDPRYLLLIGKGRGLTDQYFRKVPLAGVVPDLIPVGGSPHSDFVFTMGLAGARFTQAVPVGRIPATTSAQVAAYLNKIKEHELPVATNDWQKRVLHLSGGIQANELPVFRQFMAGFEAIAEGEYLGAEVSTLGKHSVSTVEFINVSEQINAGVNQVTFFGHSTSFVTDIDIGLVSDPKLGYNNKGKYPMFLVNGCNAGDFFTNGINFGEDWILTANKGARNFIANSAFGYDGVLKLYTDTFYETAFGDSLLINKGIGDAQSELATRLVGQSQYATLITAQVQQMVLLGDPSVRVLSSTRPDLETSDASLLVTATDNKPIHALTDSLRVSITVKNRGRANNQPLTIRLLHTIDSETIGLDSVFHPVLNTDTLVWIIARGNGNFYGQNTLDISLDPENTIEELREDNNHASWSAAIDFNGTMNLQPPTFGIVSTQNVELVFQDTDPLAPSRTYEIEIDTVADFSSTYKKALMVTSKVLARKQISILSKDSLVYYWRTRPANTAGAQWETTSFAYILGEGSGFAQLNFDQLTANTIQGLVRSPDSEKFEFEKTSSIYSVRTFGGGNSSAPVNGSFQVNNAEYYYSAQGFACRNNTINLVAFDRASAVPYLGVPFTFQNSLGRSCGREPMIINSFTSNEVQTGLNDDLFKYVDNVKQGDSVVLFAMGDAGFSLWSPATKSKLGEFGIAAADLDALTAGEPVIIVGRKGSSPGSALILRAPGPSPANQELQHNGTITGRVPEGSIKSVIIGPSLNWKSIAMKTTGKQSSDVATLDVYGIKKDGTQELMASNVSIPFDLKDVVYAQRHPNIRLVYTTTDEVALTPAQLSHWIVRFDPAPDGLLVVRDTPMYLQEGTETELDLSFVNISPIPFLDSLSVSVKVFNRTKSESEETTIRIKGPATSDSTNFSAPVSTRGKAGFNDFSINANSDHVTEQYFQNNTLELPGYLLVHQDVTDPFLDVVIDGRYLVNGDLVSPNPVIAIQLRDENTLMGKLDTTALAIFLTYPCASGICPAKRINFSSNEVTWTSDPASPDLRVEFRPASLANGQYELQIQGFDATGNESGPEPYVIEFIVDSEPSVSYSPPHPNPSSSGFFFEFQSAGTSAPEGMALHIFTSTGRLVSNFDETAAPPLHIGRNTVKWTGLDDHGVALSPGLYFYSMSVIIDGVAYTTSGKLIIQY